MANGDRGRIGVVTEVVFLGQLVERVAAGKIRVPKFQRAFVWKQSDLHALLESVLRGFPIGSILVWESKEGKETTERIGPVPVGPRPPGTVDYLLDGQQRVSTLVGTLHLPDEANPIIDDVDWRVYCDLDQLEFVRSPAGGIQPYHFPVRNLLNTAGFFAACRRIEEQEERKNLRQRWLDGADCLANAFRNYQLPLIRIREADIDSAVMVFARLNRTGRKMTADEMVSALTYREGKFHLSDKLDEFSHELEGTGFGNVDRVFLLRSVLAALNLDIYAKDWAGLVVKDMLREKLPEGFDGAVSGIKRALAFLRELGVTSDRLLPYGLQLVLLGEFFRLCRMPDEKVRKLLHRWFWVTSFTGWFGGVNTAQARRALGEIRELANGSRNGFDVVDLDAPALPFPERFDGRSARVRAFLLYLASLRPRSLGGDDRLDPGKLLSTRGTKAVGYLVSSAGALDERHFSSPANRLFVDGDKVGQAFVDMERLDDEVLADLLPTHGFPPNSTRLLRNDDRMELVSARLDTLIAGERCFMTQRAVKPPTGRTGATIADSEASDED